MALPATVNDLITTGGVINPNTYNELQQCVVRGAHGLLEFALAACDFSLEGTSGAVLGNGQWTFSAPSAIAAPIRARVGQRITNCILTFSRNVGNVTMDLCRRSGAGAVTVVASVSNGGLASGVTTMQFASPPDYIAIAGEQIYLRVICDNVANIVYKASYFSDKP